MFLNLRQPKGAYRTLYKVSDLGFKDIKTIEMKALVKTVKEAKKDEYDFV